MFEISQTEGKIESRRRVQLYYTRKLWERLIEHYQIKCYYAPLPRDFISRCEVYLLVRFQNPSKSRIIHPLSYSSVRVHSIRARDRCECCDAGAGCLVCLLPAHASRTRSTRTGRTSRCWHPRCSA